ncbi:MAG TPA: serine/threonine-protein kinase, partial [Sphingomonadaceae bacterium]|nr:serine/threonine-protein kinase [Sphingomonadaceae bacterium]
DFKQHPDSFIALQREASRQQKLAHPNIATVYDFDQTEDGLAFLVMELLEGQPLNEFIKKTVKPKGGLPFSEAFPIVQGLGNALVYAHERNIVHSDFKPGNCFITHEGQMKVLDFGIARAVKAPGAAEGETTIFDPGKLGALTPAYASLEMLEGEEPDPRDDIYALACVAYELLAGKHPFNKIPANKARDAGLSPEPIKGLKRKQWRGLQRGLAFKREDRSQTTAQFLEEFEGATSPWKNPFVMVPAIAALLVVAGFFPAQNYLEQRDIEARIAMAASGEPAQIEAMLDGLEEDNLPREQRDRIFTATKEPVLDYFDRRARDQIDIAQGHYDFSGARQTLATARDLSTVYRDTSVLLELQQYIEETENRLFAEQFDRFNEALENGNLLAVEGEDDIFDAMAIVRRIDPDHPMLVDRRLPGAYATAIDAALDDEDYDYADELGAVGLDLIPDSTNLANLTDKIAGARDRAQTRSRILAAIAAIQQAEASDEGLAAYVDVGEAV